MACVAARFFIAIAASLLFVGAAATIAAPPPAPSASPSIGVRHWLTDADPTAVCLDGSPGAVYTFPAPEGSPNAREWIVFLQGGGLCTSNETCIQRSHTTLGSSKEYPALFNATGELEGFLNRDCSVNPQFCGFNLAIVRYCDGFLYSGMRDGPYAAGDGVSLYFRGVAIRRAALTLLAQRFESFANASAVMLSGCSAGGLATVLHSSADARFLRATFPGLAGAKIKAVPLSGMFLLLPNAEWDPVVPNMVLPMYEMANATGSYDANCLANAAPGREQACASANVAFSYSTIPTFLVNSKTDAWQVQCTLLSTAVPGGEQCYSLPNYTANLCGARHHFGTCTARQMLPILNFQTTFVTHMLGNKGLHNAGNGAFISSCFAHCESLNDGYYTVTKIDGVTVGDAIKTWWDDSPTTPAVAHTHVDCDRPDVAPYECNPTCHYRKPTDARWFLDKRDWFAPQ